MFELLPAYSAWPYEQPTPAPLDAQREPSFQLGQMHAAKPPTDGTGANGTANGTANGSGHPAGGPSAIQAPPGVWPRSCSSLAAS